MAREVVAVYQGVKKTEWIIEQTTDLGLGWFPVDKTYFEESIAKEAAGDYADKMGITVRVVKVTP